MGKVRGLEVPSEERGQTMVTLTVPKASHLCSIQR